MVDKKKQKEANYIFAKALIDDLNEKVVKGTRKEYEELKDTYLQGKVTWESWERCWKERVLDNNKFKVLSLKELYNYECPPYTWRIQKIIKDKKIIAIAGDSAVYKSWFCLAMGLCVAKGIPFLDNFAVEQGGVLFIDRENSIPELQNRIEMIANGLGITKEEELPIHFLSEQSLILNEQEDRDFLDEYIEKNEIKLIIVDTYRRVISFEENDAGFVSHFLNECIKPICERRGASFIFIHHHKKGRSNGNQKDRLRGSSDFVNIIDGVIQIERKNSTITIRQTKSRSGKELEPFDVEIETDEETFFKFKYLGEKQDNSALALNCKKIMVWFNEEGMERFKVVNIKEALSLPKQRIYEALKELIKRDVIRKVEELSGVYEVIKQKTL